MGEDVGAQCGRGGAGWWGGKHGPPYLVAEGYFLFRAFALVLIGRWDL